MIQKLRKLFPVHEASLGKHGFCPMWYTNFKTVIVLPTFHHTERKDVVPTSTHVCRDVQFTPSRYKFYSQHPSFHNEKLFFLVCKISCRQV
jgi:hypothetical protein